MEMRREVVEIGAVTWDVFLCSKWNVLHEAHIESEEPTNGGKKFGDCQILRSGTIVSTFNSRMRTMRSCSSTNPISNHFTMTLCKSFPSTPRTLSGFSLTQVNTTAVLIANAKVSFH